MSFAATYDIGSSPSINLELTDYRDEQQIELDDQILRECIDFYESTVERCIENEQERVLHNLQHFGSVQGTATKQGSHKVVLSRNAFTLVERKWARSKDNWREESWPAGDTTSNHWASPTFRVALGGSGLHGETEKLRTIIVESAQESLEKWTGEKLQLTSGPSSIRVYSSGAIVSPHANRLSQVFASAIINVAQDVKEPWPLVVVSSDGITREITLLPGEMALIESSSTIRGFPYALQGKFMANLIVHFEMISPAHVHMVTVEDEIDMAAQNGDATKLSQWLHEDADLAHLQDENGWTPLHEAARAGSIETVEILLQYGADLNRRTFGGTGGTALYYALKYLGERHPMSDFLVAVGGVMIAPETESESKLTRFQGAAHDGNTQAMAALLSSSPSLAFEQDDNGWTALEIAVRGGDLDCVKLLIQSGADMNHRTNGGRGASALFLAEKYHGKDHPVSILLAKKGARSRSPTIEM